MKKHHLLIIPSVLALFAACEPESQGDSTPSNASYKVATDASETAFTLSGGKSRSVSIYVAAVGDNVDANNIDVKIKADETLVSVFNAGSSSPAIMLPSSSYTFGKNTLKVYRNGRKSLSTDVLITLSKDLADTTYVLPITIESITGSTTAQIDDDAALYIVVEKRTSSIDKGEGTKAKPYLIYEKQDLLDMHSELISGQTVYFKMMSDVDLEYKKGDVDDWVPLNTASPYDCKIDFDGNGKTISNLVSQNQSYASFFGVLNGEVRNVTFDKCYIEGGYAIGVVAGYAGDVGTDINFTATLSGVKVTGAYVYNNAGNKNGVGGICGRLNGTIDACSYEGTVDACRDFIGGIFGYDLAESQVSNCTTSGFLSGNQKLGGICGGLIKNGSSIVNCYSEMGIVTSNFKIGGILGDANLDNNPKQFNAPGNTVSGCIAWNDSLVVHRTKTANWSSGAIVGFTDPTNTLSDCYRRPDLALTIDDPDAAAYFAFTDQENAGAASPLATDCDFSTKYKAAYNGKAAGASETASDVAARLGWDTNLWNLTGSKPVLK